MKGGGIKQNMLVWQTSLRSLHCMPQGGLQGDCSLGVRGHSPSHRSHMNVAWTNTSLQVYFHPLTSSLQITTHCQILYVHNHYE